MDIEVACPPGPPWIDAVHRGKLCEALSAPIFRTASSDGALERKLAHILKAEALGRGAIRSSQSRFDDRAASEPVLRQAWSDMMERTRIADIDRVLGGLLEKPAVHRRHRSTTRYTRDGVRSVFPPAEEAVGWLDRIEAVERSAPEPFALACFAYAQAVLSHPYEDGNGRLARVMYQRSLGRSGLLAGPLLPLGPLVYANARVHDRALQHLGSTGDWEPFTEIMMGLTRKAAAFTRHVLVERYPKFET